MIARVALALVVIALMGAAHDPVTADDMVLGSPAAPVAVIEYASVGCPHCGVWSREVFPAFKRRYVDTGRVRFVLREMLTGDGALAAAGFLTARCAGPGKYYQVVEAIFAAQPEIAAAGDDLPVLLRIGKDAGVPEARVSACLGDQAALAALQARSDGYAERDHITGTPTFVIGARKLEGEQSLAELGAAIGAASATRRRR